MDNIELLTGLLEKLDPKEYKIITMRTGIGYGGITHTLEETGQEFGITRERIRQIESKALDKIVKDIPIENRDTFLRTGIMRAFISMGENETFRVIDKRKH